MLTEPVANWLPVLLVVALKAEYAPNAPRPPSTAITSVDQSAFRALVIGISPPRARALVVLGFPDEAVRARGLALVGTRGARVQGRLDLESHDVVRSRVRPRGRAGTVQHRDAAREVRRAERGKRAGVDRRATRGRREVAAVRC